MMQGALRSSVLSVRSAVCRHLRLRPHHSPAGESPCLRVAAFRAFSSDTHGAYLDKGEVTDRILSVVKRHQKVDPAKVTPNSHLQNDLGLDSLDTVEVVMAFEEEFAIEIPDADADKILTVSDAIVIIASHPRAK